jgi:hypothetical protein
MPQQPKDCPKARAVTEAYNVGVGIGDSGVEYRGACADRYGQGWKAEACVAGAAFKDVDQHISLRNGACGYACTRQ